MALDAEQMIGTEDEDTELLGEGEQQEAEAAQEEAAPQPEPELVVEIEGAEPDPDAEIEAELGDKGRAAIKALREAQRKTAAELREAKAELARAREAQQAKPDPIPEPTLEECNWNEGLFKQRMAAHLASVADQEKARLAAEAAEKAAQDDYTGRLNNYVARKAQMRAPDFDEAEATVKSTLTVQQQSVIVRTAADPAAVVLALGRNPKILQDLAAVRDVDRFAYELAKTEGKIRVTQKTPPPPESKVTGGTSAVGNSFKSALEAAEKEAMRTGDRTKVVQIKQQMRAAQAKG